jgi:pantetheine-phosphate adenylyltransferase
LKKVVYSGTFDPITRGHINIVERALEFFDTVIIAIAESKEKKPMFSLQERIQFAKDSVAHLQNVEVRPFYGLLVEFLEEVKTKFVIRGLRNGVDFEYERDMHYANKSIYNDIETIYLNSKLNDSFVSSSVVRAIMRYGGDVSHLVSETLFENKEFLNKIQQRN